jgi:hypothetical protein
MSSVVLGGFVFQDHEIPNKINFGGLQVNKIQEMVGGQRVVDAMGPSAGNISWEGRFRGASAIGRAQTLDAMRIAGAQVSLTWLGLFYTVLVSRFEAETEKAYEVTYKITCVVVDDPTQGASGISTSLDSLVGGDLTFATSILSGAPQNVSAGVSGLSAAISAVPQLQGQPVSTLAPVLLAAQAASNTIGATMAANDPALDASSPDGSDPTLLVAWLNAMARRATAQSALADGGPYVSRIATNVVLGGT